MSIEHVTVSPLIDTTVTSWIDSEIVAESLDAVRSPPAR